MSLGAGHQSAPWFPSNCSATQIFDGCLTGCPGLVEAGQDASGHETASCVLACLVLVLGSLSLVSLWTLPWPIVAIARQRLLTDGRTSRRPFRAMLCFGKYFLGDFPNPGERRAHTKPECHVQPQAASRPETSAFSLDARTWLQTTEISEKLVSKALHRQKDFLKEDRRKEGGNRDLFGTGAVVFDFMFVHTLYNRKRSL